MIWISSAFSMISWLLIIFHLTIIYFFQKYHMNTTERSMIHENRRINFQLKKMIKRKEKCRIGPNPVKGCGPTISVSSQEYSCMENLIAEPDSLTFLSQSLQMYMKSHRKSGEGNKRYINHYSSTLSRYNFKPNSCCKGNCVQINGHQRIRKLHSCKYSIRSCCFCKSHVTTFPSNPVMHMHARH